MATHHLTREELEYFVSAKPRTSYRSAYSGKNGIVVVPHYGAHLGKRSVVYFNEGQPTSYIPEAGGYWSRKDALKAAKLFQAKMKELLDAGDYAEPAA